MRRAMATADVGDDVFGEDPTVRRLEEEMAAAVGTEAALLVPSGVMGNQVALHLHGRPGTEVVCEARSHVVDWEMGAMAALSGLSPRPVAAADGLLDPEAVAAVIQPWGGFRPPSSLLVIENTHNMAGGRVYPRPRIDALLEVARRRDLPVHLDGARLFNAAVALGLPAAQLAAGFDSVMVSLSKGLGAPMGSLVCGPADFVAGARRVRKMFGGGLHQSGVIAAAGLVALRGGLEHLAIDHANARRLAEGLAELPGLAVDLDAVETNIVLADLVTTAEGGAPVFVEGLRREGVLAVPVDARRLRFVTHRDVSAGDVDTALGRIAGAFRERSR
ncbi:MAG: aminotransferase class I/II-fold pyridoxal phosphate-dependent enzyme [Acidobacteria bacterium]|nr:aminotransferase class I/II-fold pyridoxal phosphate-dependent enzyme [Acidobacteriota bacterium]